MPARRNIIQPQQQTVPPPPREGSPQFSLDGDVHESHSAPSSPVDNAISNSISGLRVRTPSPTSRPKSMMVGADQSSRVKYTTVSFQEGANTSHPPPARRGTKYANIVHEPVPASRNQGATASDADKNNVIMSPSYVGMQCSQPLPPDVSQDNPTYDTPPPPVPLRLESQDSINTSSGNKNEAPPSAQSDSSNKPLIVTEDPFGDASANAWGDSDPSAFYDRPAEAKDKLSASETVETEEDGYFEISKMSTTCPVNTADFTGDSAYEDTCSFLQDIRSRYKDRDPDEVLGNMQSKRSDTLPTATQAAMALGAEDDDDDDDDDDEVTYDLPPREEDSRPEGVQIQQQQDQQHKTDEEDEVSMGSYDFPAELNRYPLKDSVKKESSESHAKNSGGRTDGADHHAPRHNMPLPPIPDEMGMQKDPAPPLPDRPVVPTASARPGPKNTLSRDQPLPLLPPAKERPPLPPMNHPWGNKRGASANPSNPPALSSSFGSEFPPLPPRKKNPNGHSAEPPPPPYHQAVSHEPQEDPGLQELLNCGYQRADIERALRIARNDYDMARSILQEFGGRQ